MLKIQVFSEKFPSEGMDLRLSFEIGILNNILGVLNTGGHPQEEGFQFPFKRLKLRGQFIGGHDEVNVIVEWLSIPHTTSMHHTQRPDLLRRVIRRPHQRIRLHPLEANLFAVIAQFGEFFHRVIA